MNNYAASGIAKFKQRMQKSGSPAISPAVSKAKRDSSCPPVSAKKPIVDIKAINKKLIKKKMHFGRTDEYSTTAATQVEDKVTPPTANEAQG